MADLTVLYLAEMASGLKIRARHVAPNFSQIITRSNLQDGQIATLQGGATGLDGRLTAVEGDVGQAQIDINNLEARFPVGGFTIDTSPYTIDLAHPTLWVPGGLGGGSPEIILPSAASLGCVGGERIDCGIADSIVDLTIKVYNSGVAMKTRHLPGGASWSAVCCISTGGVAMWATDLPLALTEGHEALAILNANRAMTPEDLVLYSMFKVQNSVTNTTNAIVLPRISDIGARSFYLRAQTGTASNCHVTIAAHADDSTPALSTIDLHGTGSAGVTKWYEFISDPDSTLWRYRELTWNVA